MTKRRLSFVIPLLSTFSEPIWAERPDQAEQPGTMALSDTVVSATRNAASIASIPGSVQVIDAQQIQQQSGAGRRLSDILGQLVPGLAPTSGGMSNFGQTLRGRAMLVLIDGVSQNATRDNYRQLNSISPASIERIEVVSGASSVYGAGASGGMVNIITKRNQGEKIALSSRLGLTTGANFGSHGNAYDAFQSVSAKHGPLDAYVSGQWVVRNDLLDGNGNRIPQDTSQGSNMDTATYDIQSRFGFELDSDKTIKLSLQNYKDKQDTDYAKASVDKTAVAIKGLMLNEQPYTHNQAVNLNYSDRDFHGQGLMLESYWRRADALFFPALKRGKAGVSDNNSVQNVFGLRAAVDTPLPAIGMATGNLVWGADYDNERSRQRGDRYVVDGVKYTKTTTTYEMGPDIETRTKALFAQMSWDISDWTLRGGVRREWIETEVADSIAYGEIVQTGHWATLRGGSLKYDDTLYNLGAVYHLSDTQDLFANFSQGFSLPDIQRFLRDADSRFDVQTLNAQAIKVNSYELGWRGHWNRWQADVTAYENTSGVTQFYDATERVLRLINQKERVRGIENSLTFYPTEQWSVGGTYAWAKGETRRTGKWIDLPATRVSPAKTTLFVGYTGQTYDLRLQGMRLGNYDAAAKDSNGRAINGYTLVDLLGSVELPSGRVEAGVFNLTNRTYQNMFAQANARAPYANAEGRTLGISYSLNW
jgi:iron complex outermembrane receptor protein